MKRKQELFRSNFEATFANMLDECEVSWSYETSSFPYVLTHKYTPDFFVAADIAIETKGIFHASDRTKSLEVRKQHPDLIIIFCFQNPNLRLSKSSKTTYAQWANKHGFLWCTSEPRSLRTAINAAYKQRWNRGDK